MQSAQKQLNFPAYSFHTTYTQHNDNEYISAIYRRHPRKTLTEILQQQQTLHQELIQKKHIRNKITSHNSKIFIRKFHLKQKFLVTLFNPSVFGIPFASLN